MKLKRVVKEAFDYKNLHYVKDEKHEDIDCSDLDSRSLDLINRLNEFFLVFDEANRLIDIQPITIKLNKNRKI